MHTSMTKQQWQAIQTRDKGFDGQFFFGAITTGVYCKPSCPSRQAKPENVRCFENSRQALDAGFRACKRCRPEQILIENNLNKKLTLVAKHIETNADETVSLKQLGELVDLSSYYLQRKFKAHFGISPKAYQSNAKLDLLKNALKQGRDVTDAIYAAGYGSSSRVYEQVDGRLGMTPSAYRSGGKGEKIAYAIRKTSLGYLAMAATRRGVCFVHFDDKKTDLEKALQREYPNAELRKSNAENAPELDLWIQALEQHITNMESRPNLPLHLSGTAFQIRVWKFLMSVKEGEVVSYAEVAKGIGAPKSHRAVANACGANNIAVLIPCHRVLKSDGSLGGYRWQPERKRALLDVERGCNRKTS